MPDQSDQPDPTAAQPDSPGAPESPTVPEATEPGQPSEPGPPSDPSDPPAPAADAASQPPAPPARPAPPALPAHLETQVFPETQAFPPAAASPGVGGPAQQPFPAQQDQTQQDQTQTQAFAPTQDFSQVAAGFPGGVFPGAAGVAGAAGAVPPAQAVPGAATAGALAPALRFALRPAGLSTLAIVAGTTLALGLLSGLLYLLSIMSVTGSSETLSAGTVIGALFVFAGGSLGGGVTLGAPDLFNGVVSGSMGVTVFSLGTLAAVATAVFLITRHRLRRESPVAGPMVRTVAVLCDALGTAIPITLITGLVFATIEVPPLAALSLRSNWGMTLLVTTIVVGLASAAAHPGPPRTAGAVTGLLAGAREARGYLLVLATIFAPVALAVLIIGSVQADTPGMLLLGLPLLGNLVAAAIGLGHLGGISGAFTGYSGRESMLAWDLLSGSGSWLIALAVLGTLFAALWIGVRRQRLAAPSWGRVWQFPLVVFLVWVLLSLGLAGFRTNIGGSAGIFANSMNGSVQLSWWTGFAMLVWALVVSVLAEFAPGFLYGFAPAALARLGGRRSAQSWLSGAPLPGTAHASAQQPTVPDGHPFPTAQVFPTGQVFPTPPAPPEAVAGLGETPPAPPTRPEADQQRPAPFVPVAAEPGAVPQQAVPQQGQPTTALPAAGVAPLPGTLPPAQPMSPKAKKRLAVIGGGVVLLGLLAGGGAIALNVINGSRGPVGTVETYLGMLSSGDAEGANAMVDPGIKNTERVMLTNDVLGSAEHRIEVLSVREAQSTSSYASVTAEFSIDGKKYSHDFTLDAGPKESGFLNTWQISESLIVPITIYPNGIEEAQIGKTVIPLAGDSASAYDHFYGMGRVEFYAYPGSYTLTPPSSDMLVAEPQQLLVGTDLVQPTVELSAQPSEAFAEAVLAQVVERATLCVTVSTNLDEVCPYPLQDRNLSSMKITTMPTDFEELTLRGFTSSNGVFEVGRPKSGWSSGGTEDYDFFITGTISMVDGKPEVEFDRMTSYGL